MRDGGREGKRRKDMEIENERVISVSIIHVYVQFMLTLSLYYLTSYLLYT